jgi:hypothetical protein
LRERGALSAGSISFLVRALDLNSILTYLYTWGMILGEPGRLLARVSLHVVVPLPVLLFKLNDFLARSPVPLAARRVDDGVFLTRWRSSLL